MKTIRVVAAVIVREKKQPKADVCNPERLRRT